MLAMSSGSATTPSGIVAAAASTPWASKKSWLKDVWTQPGATANAVSSLSIEPMLMLACLDRGSRTLLAVQAADRFGVSVLHKGQEAVARAFATKAPVAEKWEGVGWSERDGIPAIDDALVWIACDLRDVLAAGDHVIVTGEVTALAGGEGDPLIFHGGEYLPLYPPQR